ncbi:hypothetical protein Vadar_013578 [Vaccinium darrowii]|uniref:Uncharacterized protein n=1 Tax=Vaccinium darrowii TaxID=229202 RepID=A0ACB7XQD8_9ERIC|nr:hypothetical protein Vadar_013578 [Vaccinium darrowii]
MLSHHLLSLGFKNSLVDSSLFVLHQGADLIYFLVYVDDLLITGNNPQLVDQIITQLSASFALKDLGQLHFFLGIEVVTTPKGILLSQQKYAMDLLVKAGMSDCRPCSTPSSLRHDDDSTKAPMSNPEMYRSLVGSLQYLTLTRPELSFAVNSVCQHMHMPLECHFTAVKRILRYIKGTLDQGLLFSKGALSLAAFSDADWAGSSVDRRSTGGYCVFLGQNLISWSAKKQATVARSSTEAEYKALTNAASELVWLLQLFKDLHTPVFSAVPTLWCDNNSALALATNPVFHAHTKHIEVDFHFVREKIALKQLHVRHVPSDFQIADIFTKPLPVARFLCLKDKLMLSSIPASVCGGLSE